MLGQVPALRHFRDLLEDAITLGQQGGRGEGSSCEARKKQRKKMYRQRHTKHYDGTHQ
jgi:hypothetical protein